MRFKNGVTLNLREEITKHFRSIDIIWNTYGQEAWITCGNNGKHSKYSLHYVGLAIDLRTRYFTAKEKKGVAKTLREWLGKDYYILAHKTHIHLAYKPTR